MTPFIESLYKEALLKSDEAEVTEILNIIQEAKEEGYSCEVFFLDEYPQIEGWCGYLEDLGFRCTYEGTEIVQSWTVRWGEL
jgi:hypothetical protein